MRIFSFDRLLPKDVVGYILWFVVLRSFTETLMIGYHRIIALKIDYICLDYPRFAV
jgi:hypothetical protein